VFKTEQCRSVRLLNWYHSLKRKCGSNVMKSLWERVLKLNQSQVAGLDVGSSSVRMVQLEKGQDGYTVIAADIVEIRRDNKDKASVEADVVNAIRQCMKTSKVRTRKVVCGLSGPEVAVRPFSLPQLGSNELEGAIMIEAAQVCPFNIEDGVVDCQLASDQDTAKGILVAATNDVIRRKTHAAQKASLDCVLMDVDGLALLNCFNEHRNGGNGEPTAAILDVGASSTTLAVICDTGLPFVRNMPYAGNEIIAQVARDNNVSTDVVRRELYAGGKILLEPEKLRASLEGACEKLINDVTETLRYHTAQQKSSFIEEVLVCGGFALVEGFVEILDERLTVKASVWNPFETMNCSVGRHCLDVVQKKGPAMAVAAGLAMRSV